MGERADPPLPAGHNFQRTVASFVVLDHVGYRTRFAKHFSRLTQEFDHAPLRGGHGLPSQFCGINGPAGIGEPCWRGRQEPPVPPDDGADW